jgi:hypothetical protein
VGFSTSGLLALCQKSGYLKANDVRASGVLTHRRPLQSTVPNVVWYFCVIFLKLPKLYTLWASQIYPWKGQAASNSSMTVRGPGKPGVLHLTTLPAVRQVTRIVRGVPLQAAWRLLRHRASLVASSQGVALCGQSWAQQKSSATRGPTPQDTGCHHRERVL